MSRPGARPGTASHRVVGYLLDAGLRGAGPLCSARQLAAAYLDEPGYADNDARVDALVAWETSKNFTTGFLTGLGGVIALPVAVPSALGASWLIQARMVGAIACIYGHSPASQRVRTKMLLSLAGDVAKDAMRDLGLGAGSRLDQRAVDQIPGRVLVEFNKRIGAGLLARAGQSAGLRITRGLPVIGGVTGGAIDAVVCRTVGRTAKMLFRRPQGAVIDGEIVLPAIRARSPGEVPRASGRTVRRAGGRADPNR